MHIHVCFSGRLNRPKSQDVNQLFETTPRQGNAKIVSGTAAGAVLVLGSDQLSALSLPCFAHPGKIGTTHRIYK